MTTEGEISSFPVESNIEINIPEEEEENIGTCIAVLLYFVCLVVLVVPFGCVLGFGILTTSSLIFGPPVRAEEKPRKLMFILMWVNVVWTMLWLILIIGIFR